MADFNDFGFSTVSEDEYKAQHTSEVNTAKEVATTGCVIPKWLENNTHYFIKVMGSF